MTRQEQFDHTLNKIREQGKPSIDDADEYTFCLYRGPEGLKCGVGHHIPDDMYNPEMDTLGGFQVNALVQNVTRYLGLDDDIMDKVQKAHDNAARYHKDGKFLETFEKNMKDAARHLELSYSF